MQSHPNPQENDIEFEHLDKLEQMMEGVTKLNAAQMKLSENPNFARQNKKAYNDLKKEEHLAKQIINTSKEILTQTMLQNHSDPLLANRFSMIMDLYKRPSAIDNFIAPLAAYDAQREIIKDIKVAAMKAENPSIEMKEIAGLEFKNESAGNILASTAATITSRRDAMRNITKSSYLESLQSDETFTKEFKKHHTRAAELNHEDLNAIKPLFEQDKVSGILATMDYKKDFQQISKGVELEEKTKILEMVNSTYQQTKSLEQKKDLQNLAKSAYVKNSRENKNTDSPILAAYAKAKADAKDTSQTHSNPFKNIMAELNKAPEAKMRIPAIELNNLEEKSQTKNQTPSIRVR